MSIKNMIEEESTNTQAEIKKLIQTMKVSSESKGNSGASFEMLLNIEKSIKKVEKELKETMEGLASFKETYRERNKIFEKGMMDFNL